MLSRKTQYAFKALGYLAGRYPGPPVLISEIAREKHIPLKFLENILLELRHAGILDSKKGKQGGYFLRAAPESTSLAAIIRLLDGPIAMFPCVSLYFHETCTHCDAATCRINAVFIEARDATLGVLEKKTLADLAE